MRVGNLDIPEQAILAFCQKWKLKELSLFGSALRPDFRADSDVDFLVTFQPGAAMTFESFVEMRDELSALVDQRSIDLVEKRLLKNPFRRHEILTTREVIYAA